MKALFNTIFRCGLIGFIILCYGLSAFGQITGMDDWRLYIDPGHSQKENMGLYNYSEAEKVLQVAHHLRTMFLEQTDIQEIYMARETDTDFISLAGRVDEANTLGADFYYSIHSDAGAPQVNSTVMLFGGWRSNGVTVEKSPQGGGYFGEILDQDLSGAMRIPTRGNWADRNFYLGIQFHHDNQWPYLYVNRVSTMASLLSEGGFHTNPGQQQLNLNHEWKILEALSAFRSLLEWHEIDRLPIGIVAGIIKDAESGLPINGATVKIDDHVYVTDTYESLFNQYSANPDQLRNGFYFIDGLTPESTVEVEFTREGYTTLTESAFVVSDPNGRTKDNITFLDVELVSNLPPTVTQVTPASTENLLPTTPIDITFSRKMNRESIEDAISISPEVEYELEWLNDFTIRISTGQFAFLSEYTLTIDGAIAKNELTDQHLDGNGDGEPGGDFILDISTMEEDNEPPFVIDYAPLGPDPQRSARPIIRVVYDEPIMENSIVNNTLTLTSHKTGNQINSQQRHAVIKGKSVLHLYPTTDLSPSESYQVAVNGGLKDQFDNATQPWTFTFYALNEEASSTTVIDNFNSISQWWSPQQAGQTEGIITEETSMGLEFSIVNNSLGSAGSMRLSYGWDLDFVGTPFIREYLPPPAPQNANKFNKTHKVQVFLFGDGSGNQFRFMIRDGLNQLEGSRWYTIDWIGWKLITWDLAKDQIVPWINGNGVLDGTDFFIDSFQLRYQAGGDQNGTIYFDQLRFIEGSEVEYPETFSNGFEAYKDFSDDIAPWIIIDKNQSPTIQPPDFSFEGAGLPFGFLVLNPELTSTNVANNFPAAEGFRYLVASGSINGPDNKWLVSPQIKIDEKNYLSFKARSYQSTPKEKFEVKIAIDSEGLFDFDQDDYINAPGTGVFEPTANWEEYHLDLSEYTGQVIRFSIRYISDSGTMLMLDDFSLTEAPIAGINDLIDGIEIYPNPTRGTVNIKSSEKINSINVYNSSGQVVIIEQGNPDKNQLELGSLNSGLYLIRVETIYHVKTFKILLNP